MQPRKYQEEALRALRETRKNDEHSGLVVMATGLGKTVVSAFDVRQYMFHNKGRALFLCHNNGILEQNMLMFQCILDGEFTYGFFNGLKKAPKADLLFASFQTMLDHKEEFAPDTFKYIVVDEAHHAPAETFKKVISYFKPDFLLGITATPHRLDGLELEDIFGPVTYNLGLAEAIRRELLVNINYNLMLDEMVDLDSIVVNGEKISMGELNRRLFVPRRDEEIARIIKDKIIELNSNGTLIFCRSIEHAKTICSLIKGSKVIHSNQPAKENQEILESFRMGETSILVSVDQLNEGIDIPHADLIVFLRSTVSPLVFYQQLGRGLRLHEGKDYVTVLDFVGNYDRIQIIRDLQRDIYPSNKKAENEYFFLSIEPSHFRNIKVDIDTILDRIDNLTYGWSDKDIIAQAQMMAKELGRAPFREEFDNDPRTANSSTAINRFGAWNKFIMAAGLKVNVMHCTNDELINQVQMLAKELGKTPTRREFDKDTRTVGSKSIAKRFGTWNKFIMAAGLELSRTYNKSKPKKLKTNTPTRTVFTNEELVRQVQMLAEELGRTPTNKEFSMDHRTAHRDTISRHFGSWNKFIMAAGLKVNVMHCTNDELINQVQMLAKELGKSPTVEEFDKDPRVAAQRTVTKRFGSWNKFLEAAGLTVNKY